MSSILVILVGTVLVNTFLLMQNDSTLSGTREGGSVASAIRLAGATSLVLIVASLSTNLLWRTVATQSNDSILFAYALMVVASAALTNRLAQNQFLVLARAFATSPLLIVSNSLALGTGILSIMEGALADLFLTACTLAVSFAAALSLFVALVSRIVPREVPTAFRSAPITLVSAGLVTLALMGFTGLLRG